MEFISWFAREGTSFPITMAEVSTQIAEWLAESDEDALDTEISVRNMRNRVRCDRYDDGAECDIDLVGFVDGTPRAGRQAEALC